MKTRVMRIPKRDADEIYKISKEMGLQCMSDAFRVWKRTKLKDTFEWRE